MRLRVDMCGFPMYGKCGGRSAMRKRDRSKISVEWDAQTGRDGNYTRPALAM